jgi:hypothetical protein
MFSTFWYHTLLYIFRQFIDILTTYMSINSSESHIDICKFMYVYVSYEHKNIHIYCNVQGLSAACGPQGVSPTHEGFRAAENRRGYVLSFSNKILYLLIIISYALKQFAIEFFKIVCHFLSPVPNTQFTT